MAIPLETPQSDQDMLPFTPYMFRYDWKEAMRIAVEKDHPQEDIEAAIMAARGALDHARQPSHHIRALPSHALESVGDSEASVRAIHRGCRPASRTVSQIASDLTSWIASQRPSWPARITEENRR